MQHISKVENPAVQAENFMLLNNVTAMLSNRVTCRQQLFAKYFQEEEGEPCELCDNCQESSVPTTSFRDLTESTKELITCLNQMVLIKPRIKLSELVMTYIGSKAKDVIDSKFNMCALYGKGKAQFKTAKQLSKFVEHLIYEEDLSENFRSLGESSYIVYITCDHQASEIFEGKRSIVVSL